MIRKSLNRYGVIGYTIYMCPGYDKIKGESIFLKDVTRTYICILKTRMYGAVGRKAHKSLPIPICVWFMFLLFNSYSNFNVLVFIYGIDIDELPVVSLLD